MDVRVISKDKFTIKQRKVLERLLWLKLNIDVSCSNPYLSVLQPNAVLLPADGDGQVPGRYGAGHLQISSLRKIRKIANIKFAKYI